MPEIKKSENNTKFIYIITACVFDGHRGMYKESDIPYPENFGFLGKIHSFSIFSMDFLWIFKIFDVRERGDAPCYRK